LLVARDDAAGDLVLAWESPRNADTQVWQGDLDALWIDSWLNDLVVAEVAESEWRLPQPTRNSYFLLSGSCNGLVCTRGRDDAGNERGIPGCEIFERGEIYADAARCLVGGEGIVRDAAEYDLLAACFTGDPPPRPGPGVALVWATDHSNAACGTCLEFTCAQQLGGANLEVRRLGRPWGDCDAIHDGGAWALVPAAPIITLVEEMPPFPEYGLCD
jgi:hypothetical protein